MKKYDMIQSQYKIYLHTLQDIARIFQNRIDEIKRQEKNWEKIEKPKTYLDQYHDE